ncbi:MAG: NADPH-dependent F420 reductase [Halobacteria archaeon]
MEIGIIGGTGDLGEGLAIRLAGAGHDVTIGSRDSDKAREHAEMYSEKTGADIDGVGNQKAAEKPTAILAVPYRHMVSTVENLDFEDNVVVSPVVSMEPGPPFEYVPPEEGSASEELRELLPGSVSLAGAFHNVAAKRLIDTDRDLGLDIVVFGDPLAKARTKEMVESIDGLRSLDGGSYENAAMVESITPLLINVGIKNGLDDLGIQVN